MLQVPPFGMAQDRKAVVGALINFMAEFYKNTYPYCFQNLVMVKPGIRTHSLWHWCLISRTTQCKEIGVQYCMYDHCSFRNARHID